MVISADAELWLFSKEGKRKKACGGDVLREKECERRGERTLCREEGGRGFM